MNLLLSAPSKTFLTGEHAVMAGGPALLLATTPRFELRAFRASSGGAHVRGIPEGSPAAVWLRQRAPVLDGWTLEFRDPHERRGGFGASGAQFLLVHALTTYLQSDGKLPASHTQDAFNDHQVCSNSAGSGADVLTQCAGSVALVDVKGPTAQSLIWPYKDLGFAIIRTGADKIATHEHLSGLRRDQMAPLIAPAIAAASAFARVKAEEFVDKVRDYAGALRSHGMQTARTLELLKPFEQQKWCLAAKGCGAYGADTLLVLYPKHEEGEVAQFTRAQNLELISTTLAPGLEIAPLEEKN